jgi:hypothetical protein
MNLFEVVQFISKRIARIFLADESGKRPVNGQDEIFNDPHWKDLVLFYEYFHGDSGKGIGASHQTGWTGCITEILKVIDIEPSESIDKISKMTGVWSIIKS